MHNYTQLTHVTIDDLFDGFLIARQCRKDISAKNKIRYLKVVNEYDTISDK